MSSFSSVEGDLGENREPVRELQAWNAWFRPQDLIKKDVNMPKIFHRLA